MIPENEAQIKMDDILFGYGLQITLVTLIKSLKKMTEKRGFAVYTVMVEESIRGALKGYLRRYDDEYGPLTEESFKRILGEDTNGD
jgi:hypothetical protein